MYELLTSVTPFDSKLARRLGNEELLQLIRNQDPPKPSSRLKRLELERQQEIADERQIKQNDLERLIKPELDWIVMKSLQKQRVHRYQSAGAIAADVERFLNQQPVEACPPSTVYVAKKFLTRHKFVSAVTALIAFILIAATGLSLWQASESHAAKLLSDQHLDRALRAKQEVSDRDNLLRKLHYALDMKAAWQFWKAGNPRAARQTLERHLPVNGEEDPRDFAWRYLNGRLNYELNRLVGHESPVLEVAVSPNDRWIASCDRGGHVLIWDFVTGAKLQDLSYDSREVTTLVFSPDNHWLATAGQDSKIHVWHTSDWRESRTVGKHDGTITSIAWSPDGRSIASGGRDQAVRIWDPQSGKCIQEFSNLTDVVRCVVWAADGSHLAAADGPTVRLWETQTWRLEKQWHDQQDTLHSLAFSPDDRQLAAAGYGKDIWVYDVQQLVVATTLRTDERYWCVSFSPDNRCLLAGSTLNGPLIWERSGQGFARVFSANHVEGGLRTLVFADQGRKLVTACESPGLISVLDYKLLFADRRQLLNNRLIAKNCQQDRLATVAADGSIHFSSFQTGQAFGSLNGRPQPLRAAAFSVTADKLATATEHELCVWDVRQGVLLRQMPDAPWLMHRLLFSPSGRLLACGNDRGDVLLFDVATGQMLGEFPCAGHAGPYFAFSPDESLLATTTDSFKIQLWSTRDAKPQTEFTTRSLACLQFSSDGGLLIVGGERGIEFWDIADNKLVKSLAQPEAVTDIAISPDDRTLASLDIQGNVRLWNLPTDSEMFSIVQHNQSLDWVQFASPTRLVVGARFPDSPNPGFLIFEARE